MRLIGRFGGAPPARDAASGGPRCGQRGSAYVRYLPGCAQPGPPGTIDLTPFDPARLRLVDVGLPPRVAADRCTPTLPAAWATGQRSWPLGGIPGSCPDPPARAGRRGLAGRGGFANRPQCEPPARTGPSVDQRAGTAPFVSDAMARDGRSTFDCRALADIPSFPTPTYGRWPTSRRAAPRYGTASNGLAAPTPCGMCWASLNGPARSCLRMTTTPRGGPACDCYHLAQSPPSATRYSTI